MTLTSIKHYLATQIYQKNCRLPLSRQAGICTLLSHQDTLRFYFSINSLFYWSSLRFPLYIISDGTLSTKDVKFLTLNLPASIVNRPMADKQIRKIYKPYQALYKFRFQSGPNYKLKLDLIALNPFKTYLILDADVLFLNKPSQILRWLHSKKPNPLVYYNSKEFQHNILHHDYFSTLYALRKAIYQQIGCTTNPNFSFHIFGAKNKAFFSLDIINHIIKSITDIGYDHNPHVDELIMSILLTDQNPINLNPYSYFHLVTLSNKTSLPIPSKPTSIHFSGDNKRLFWKYALTNRFLHKSSR